MATPTGWNCCAATTCVNRRRKRRVIGYNQMGMQELAFWKAVIVDESNFLETFLALLAKNGIRYCVIGGQGVNAYVDPLVSLDLGFGRCG